MKYRFYLWVLIGFFAATSELKAQLYYKDIIATEETNELMSTYRSNHVKSVVLSASNPDDSPAEGFAVRQEIAPDFSQMTSVTGTGDYESTLISTFDEAGRVTMTIDTGLAMTNRTLYEYDENGNVKQITSIATDSSGKLNETETREFEYDENGAPVSAKRSTNGKLVSEIRFKLDEKGNVIEETPYKNEIAGETVYYYYNSKNQLTDVVRFNQRVGKLLPDYLFEYDSRGRIAQKITVPGNSGNYLIWRYQYNENDLKVREAIFNKQKQLTGKIEYRYQYFS